MNTNRECFAVNTAADRLSIIDALNARLEQVSGIIGMVQCNASNDQTGDLCVTGGVVASVLWAAGALIDEAQQLVDLLAVAPETAE